MSAGVILVDREGRVLLQLRDNDPAIMYPDHWGITGGAALPGESPEETARREVREETGLELGTIEPFRAYYFEETRTAAGARATSRRSGADYELYLFHAPCDVPAGEMSCGEGRELRFFAPDEVDALDIAYNHREVLADFFASPAYLAYVRGTAFGAESDADVIAGFRASVAAGEPWFEALLAAIARWRRPEETVEGRRYRYLVGGEAFDWLLLAERLLLETDGAVDAGERERLLFEALAPAAEEDASCAPVADERLRASFGEAKHRAHLNYLYGVTVEEALQYAVELELQKERANLRIKDRLSDDERVDPLYERIYGRPRAELLAEYRAERGMADADTIALSDLREFAYWLFKYRVQNQEPARVASDTRKALAQLSAIELAARRRRERARESAGP
jgi:8-oxo-dGTP pyrophosphatase MutT (NUDIX family)